MTDLAEVAVQRSLALLSAGFEALYGEPRGADGQRVVLGVVGMGKLGGREPNVSSDIDLIFVHEDDGETTGGARSPLSTQEYFTRLGRRLIGVLSEVTADGYVFRVDMRLRPNGDSGPLVCSPACSRSISTCRGASGSAMRGSRAARVGRRQRRGATAGVATRVARQAVRVPPLPRLRRDRRDPLAAPADPAGSRAPRVDAARQGRRHQARARRDPRDRIQCPGVPADPRRRMRNSACGRRSRCCAMRRRAG